jgi:hypothetical protein
MTTAAGWNALVALNTPTVAQVRAIRKTWTQLRPDVKNMIFIGDNLVLMCPRGPTIEGQIVNLICVLRPNIYSNIKLSPNVNFQFLEQGTVLNVPFRTSAFGFLESLKTLGAGKMDLSTVSDFNGKITSWEIIYGKSLTLQFAPLTAHAPDPSKSCLTTLMYAYQQPYTGILPPNLG